MDALIFIGLTIALVLGLIGFFGRCRTCGSWAHAFNPGHAADIPDGKANSKPSLSGVDRAFDKVATERQLRAGAHFPW
jgi:hypothetical protein